MLENRPSNEVMKIIKAEILLTRRCNLSCSYCNMKRNDVGELSAENWIRIFETLTNELGCPFYPIYGAEPLLHPGVYDIIKYFGGKDTAAYSLLTNATMLTDEVKIKLLDAGLQSITLSVDSLSMPSDESISRRNDQALAAIDWALENSISDVQGTSCVHAQNITEVPDLVRYLSDRGVWYSFDVVHDNKNKTPGLSKVSNPDPNYQFVWDRDWWTIVDFLTDMVDMKEAGYKIYQSLEWLESALADPEKVIVDRSWWCGDYPAWITVDSDGQVLICDDYMQPSGIYATDLPDRWDEFIGFKRQWVKSCRGCSWSTHFMSYGQLSNVAIEDISHGRMGKKC